MQEIAIFFDKQKSEKSITVTDPEVAKEWDYAKNLADISTVTRGSYLDAYWKCSQCGYLFAKSPPSTQNASEVSKLQK